MRSTPSWLSESRDALKKSRASLKTTGECLERLGSKLAAFQVRLDESKNYEAEKRKGEAVPAAAPLVNEANLPALSVGPLSTIVSFLDVRQALLLSSVCTSLRDAVLASDGGVVWGLDEDACCDDDSLFHRRTRFEGELARDAIVELLCNSFGPLANWPVLFIEAYDAIESRRPFTRRTLAVLRAFVLACFERRSAARSKSARVGSRETAVVLSLLLQMCANTADHRIRVALARSGAVRSLIVAARRSGGGASLNLHLFCGICELRAKRESERGERQCCDAAIEIYRMGARYSSPLQPRNAKQLTEATLFARVRCRAGPCPCRISGKSARARGLPLRPLGSNGF